MQFHVIKSDNIRIGGLTGNDQFALFIGPDIVGGIVVQRVVRIIVFVHRRPPGIGPVVKFTMGDVEFVGKDQFVNAFGIVRGIGGGRSGGRLRR